MTTREQERLAALHEYRLLGLPAGDVEVPGERNAGDAGRR